MEDKEIFDYLEQLEKLINSNSEEKSQEKVIELLTKALADEWLASYQYWVCKNLARGQGRTDAIPEFDQHFKDEMEHADKIMLRIKELGGKPITHPRQWTELGNPWTEVVDTNVIKQLDITIKAEHDAIDFYQTIIDYCKGFDEITMRLIRGIMSDQAEHAYDLEMLREEY